MEAVVLTPTQLHAVTRSHGFDADGVHRERGEVLDTSTWRSTKPLVDSRSLAPFYGSEDSLTTCECGRRWLDAASAADHRCPERPLKPRAPRAKKE